MSAYLSYSLAAAHRRLSVELNRELKKMGVQIETWLVLQTLQTGHGYTMTELAGIVLMNPPTLTKLVDRMVAEGLVQRQLDVEDNRRVQLMLTDLGMDVCQKVTEHVEAQNDMIVRTIGEERATILREVLETLA
ncbi:MarR family winged helix-turn-helix transcriptional regulator [Hoeflea sp.]|uniref:MarR family winged helix-turn-helix transcriptional regulator n=1 Tax=Hoeflea sp. TaxID=1940281 RepID=UPI003B0260B5